MMPLAGSGSGPLGPLLPEHISEFVVGLVLFGIIWFAIRRWVAPAFEKMYAKREDEIQGGIERAEKAQAEAEQAKKQYEAQLAEANVEARKILDKARADGSAAADGIRRKAEADSRRIVATGRAQLDADRIRVIGELRSDVGLMATDLAGKILGESLTDDQRARRTVDEFMDQLAQMTPAAKDA